MKTITKIEVQKKNPDRVSIFIDEVFAFGAFMDDVLEHGIRKGLVLDDESYSELVNKLQLRKAKYKALEYLKTGSKTESQVRKKLKEKEYEDQVIEIVIEFLKSYNYVDDEDFKKRYIENQTKFKHKSIKRIQYELYQKGVEDRNLSENLEDMSDYEQENIKYFLIKYKYNSAMDYLEKRKIITKLLRKGFTYDNIKKITGEIEESFDI